MIWTVKRADAQTCPDRESVIATYIIGACFKNVYQRYRNHAMPVTFVPFSRTAQFAICFDSNGQKCQNVLHYQAENIWDVAGLIAHASVLTTLWSTYLQSGVNSATTLTRILARSLENQFAPSIEYLPYTPMVGAYSGTPAPGNVTACVKLGSSQAGRSYRGRLYHVGMSATSFNGNQIVSSYVTFLKDAYNEFRSSTELEDKVLVVASRYHNGEPRITGIVTPVVYVSVNGDVDSQRRRLAGRGQ